MTKGFTNHNTHDMQFINCPKYKMHICVEQTDIGELIFGSDVPRYEIVWHIHGESNPRGRTMDLLNLVVPDPKMPMTIPENTYQAVMEIYGIALKKEYNKYAKSKGWNQIEVNK